MAGPDKRARKKSHRDRVVAQQWAAYRRRRMIRWTSLGLVMLLIGGLVIGAILSGDGDEGNGGDTNVAASPTESEPPAAPEPPGCNGEPKPDYKEYKEPEQVTKEGVDYGAVMTTSMGEIEIDFLEDKAPETVNNFVFLSQEGYFDGLCFHRIEGDFVIQAGDPNGQNGAEPDGPGYSIPDELPKGSKEYVFGTLAMANAGPNTGGSQFFFITHDPKEKKPAGLQPDYSIFGMAVGDESLAVLEAISKVPVKGGNDPVEAVKPKEPVVIESIEVTEK